MADALLFAGAHAESRSRARIDWNFHLFLDLLAPALLLGLLRLWSSAMAPRLGVYFTAEALLIAYAYFAVVRGVHLNARSYDWAGRYSRELALKAGQDFHRGLLRYRVKIALVVLPLLLAALVLDVLTKKIRRAASPQYQPLDPVRGDHGVGEVWRSGDYCLGALVAAAARRLRRSARAGGQAARCAIVRADQHRVRRRSARGRRRLQVERAAAAERPGGIHRFGCSLHGARLAGAVAAVPLGAHRSRLGSKCDPRPTQRCRMPGRLIDRA